MSQVTCIDESLWAPKSGEGVVSSVVEKKKFAFYWLINEKFVKNSEFQFPEVTSSWNSEIDICWNSTYFLQFLKISCVNSMTMLRCDVSNLAFFHIFLILQQRSEIRVHFFVKFGYCTRKKYPQKYPQSGYTWIKAIFMLVKKKLELSVYFVVFTIFHIYPEVLNSFCTAKISAKCVNMN